MIRLFTSIGMALILSVAGVSPQAAELIAVVAHTVHFHPGHVEHTHEHHSDNPSHYREISYSGGKLVISHVHGEMVHTNENEQNHSGDDRPSDPHQHTINIAGGNSLLLHGEVHLELRRPLDSRAYGQWSEIAPLGPHLDGLFRPPKS